MPNRRPQPGFTLIELLVVIAIIALLISILLPALSAAKENARATVCLSNIKQVTQGFFLYAEEYGTIPGTYWQGPINLDWGGTNNQRYLENPDWYDHPLEASIMRTFLSHVDKILECPSAKREANAIYDYTVLIRMAGANPDLPWEMMYSSKPIPGHRISSRKRFPALPFLFEEDSEWYNGKVFDGSWANKDQITDRHNKGGHIGYLDGSVSHFVSPKGGNRDQEEDWDLIVQDLTLRANRKGYPVWGSNEDEFGWVNDPR